MLALAEGLPESAPLPQVWDAVLLRRQAELERMRLEAVTGYLLNRDIFQPLTFDQLTAHLTPPDQREQVEKDREEAEKLSQETAMLAKFRAIGRKMDESG